MKKWILCFMLILPITFAVAETIPKESIQVVDLTVTDHGFEPKTINVKPGIPVTLKITRTSELTCATEIVIPTKKIKKDLPLNQLVEIKIGKLKKGEIRFGCGMKMMESGEIHVE